MLAKLGVNLRWFVGLVVAPFIFLICAAFVVEGTTAGSNSTPLENLAGILASLFVYVKNQQNLNSIKLEFQKEQEREEVRKSQKKDWVLFQIGTLLVFPILIWFLKAPAGGWGLSAVIGGVFVLHLVGVFLDLRVLFPSKNETQ